MNKWLYKLEKIFRKHPVDESRKDQGGLTGLSDVLKRRELELYGEELYAQRRLYEKWVVRDRWNLATEAVPLVLGYDPEAAQEGDTEFDRLGNELYEHAKHCITHNLTLGALNREDSPENWEVSPTEFYCWAAVSRVQMPEPLINLMEFVISTVKRDHGHGINVQPAGGSPDPAARKFDLQKEQVLGAALAVLAEYPDQCRNRKGRINVASITALIRQHHAVWFQDEEAVPSETTMQDLINRWIKTLKPVIHG